MIDYVRASWGRNKGSWLIVGLGLAMVAAAAVAHFGFGVVGCPVC